MRPRSNPHLNPLALFALAMVFMALPAVLAFAEAMPQSARSKATIASHVDDMTRDLKAAKFEVGAPIYFQIIKAENELTAYVAEGDGTYRAFRTWPICRYSGGLGPKRREGDGKSPEGFYMVKPSAMNPASRYHLSFNLGFPNAYDRAHGYTGSYLMVHGACVSIGCYAMTDGAIDELWMLMSLAFDGGQRAVPVHIFPFEMTDVNMKVAMGHRAHHFWRELQPIWVAFQATARVPEVDVVDGRYVMRPYQ